MIEVAVTELGRHELTFAAGVLGRAFRDNPLTVAVLGQNPLRRMRCGERLHGSYVALMERPPLAARRGDWVVGVCGMAPPGACQPSFLQRLRLMPAVLGWGPGALARGLRAWAAFEKRDPKERHWHLGPVAVEPGLQGMGVGSQMMELFCAMMDAEGEMAFLETDKPENVRFYEKFGFVTVEEVEILGVPSWFMVRRPTGK